MNTFGFQKNDSKYSFVADFVFNFLKRINLLFLFFLVVSFFSFGFIQNIVDVVLSEDKILALDQKIDDIALYTWAVDDEISDFLYSYKKVRQNYVKNKNIFEINNKDINYITNFLQNRQNYIKEFIPKDYSSFFDFMVLSLDYKDDIKKILGVDSTRRYLLALQNNGESRPNGGFFGSYGILEVKNGHIQNIQIKDVYEFNSKFPNLDFDLPYWSRDLFGAGSSKFVSSNMFGFSDMDGKNIMNLYNSSDLNSINGVIFLQSKMFVDIINGFENFLYRRQFINTSINLIRGLESSPNHKKIYINEAYEFIRGKKINFIQKILKSFDKIKTNNYINVYIPDISNDFEKLLTNNNLTHKFKSNRIYIFNKNIAYNKLDRFVSKYVELYQDNKTISTNYGNPNSLHVDSLNGEYIMDIYYNLNIPKHYYDIINSMEENFDIQLTGREKHILGIDILWDNEIYIYLPKNIKINKVNINNGFYNWTIVQSPFAKILKLKAKLENNNKTAYVQIKIEK